MDRRLLKFLIASVLSLFFALFQAGATIDVTLQMQLGNPSLATSDSNNHSHFLIQRTVEALDYNDALRVPNWASWDLTASDVGTTPRSSVFYPDNTLPAGFYVVQPSDYNGAAAATPGYDRGHMCPSDDRTDNVTDNNLVFYMSNVLPQASANNEMIWADLEEDSRTLATAGNELLITCGGNIYSGAVISPSGIAYVPSYVWKIIVVVPPGGGTALSRVTTSDRVIAVYMPNTLATGTDPWSKYVTSVNQIQTATGYTFFSALPSNVAAVLRAKVDGATAPSISSFSPSSGGVGTSVVVNGSAFTSATNVAFNGASATFTVNSDTKITATVPAGGSTGAITLIAPGGLATSSGNFTVSGSAAPILTSFLPTSGTAGASVVLTGSGLSTASSVTFNGASVPSYTINSNTQITTTVPVGATAGAISVVTASGTATSSTNFTVNPAPLITSFLPTSGTAGTTVVVTGSALSAASSLAFNGAGAGFTVNSNTQITGTVPAGATTGAISAVTLGGTATSSGSFIVTVVPAPTITSFLPTSGTVGTSVVVTGSAFNSASSVTFNGATAGFTVNSNTQITGTVPVGAGTGSINVVTPGGSITSSGNFTVTSGSTGTSGTGTVVISQVYGGGGNSGAVYKNDFIELYNSGTSATDLSAYAVQYTSAAGTSWSVTSLTGSILPGHYYLVWEAPGSGGTANLPLLDGTGSISMGAASGKVALTNNQTPLSGANPTGAAVVDLVGYGSSATGFEGTGPAPAPGNTTSDLRANGGGQDTNNNASDFTAGAVNPRNSSNTAMDTWRSSTFSSTELANILISGTLANPSGDGMSNLAKYAFNLNPHLANATTAITTSIQTSGNTQTITLTYSKNHYAADITYTPQMSTDLVGWTTSGVSAPTVVPLNSTTDSVSISASSAGTDVFLRVMVTH